MAITTINNDPDKSKNEMSFEERERELKAKDAAEKSKLKSKFRDFIQWNNATDIYKAEDFLLKENATAYRVFKFLIHNMDKTNAIIVSQKTMQEFLGLSRQTISKSVNYLKDKGFIDIFKTGTSNVYAINDDIVWKTHGNKTHFSKFKANVVIGSSEQEKEVEKKINQEFFKKINIEKKK